MTDSADDDFVLVPSLDRPNLNSPAPHTAQPKDKRFNILAAISLLASLLSFVGFLGIGGLTGIVTGHIALNQIKHHGGPGRGMALAGTILGYITLALAIIALILLYVILHSLRGINISG